MSMISLGCGCDLGEVPPADPVTPDQVQTMINTALVNQQLALASQLEQQRKDERAQVMEWQAQRRAAAQDEQAAQWITGIDNKTVLLVGAGIAVVGMIAYSKK